MSADIRPIATPAPGSALQMKWSVRLLLGGVLLVLPAVFLLGKSPGPTDVAVAIGVTFVMGALLVLAARPRWWVDRHGITSRAFVGKKVALAWVDVTEITPGAGSAFCVLRGSGATISIDRNLSGLDVLASLLLDYAPPASLRNDRLRRAPASRAGRFAPRLEVPAIAEDDDPAQAARARWEKNPLYVLGIAADASRGDAERAGRKLLGLLAVGATAAKTYATPFGSAARTEDAVRAALADVASPDRRAAAEAEALAVLAQASAEGGDDRSPPWPHAFRAAGWRAG